MIKKMGIPQWNKINQIDHINREREFIHPYNDLFPFMRLDEIKLMQSEVYQKEIIGGNKDKGNNVLWGKINHIEISFVFTEGTPCRIRCTWDNKEYPTRSAFEVSHFIALWSRGEKDDKLLGVDAKECILWLDDSNQNLISLQDDHIAEIYQRNGVIRIKKHGLNVTPGVSPVLLPDYD